MDVTKALPKEIEFSRDGMEFTAEFHYPWLPARCNICEKWGHTERVCVKNKKEYKQSEGSSVRKSPKVKKDTREVGVKNISNILEEEILKDGGELIMKKNEEANVVNGNEVCANAWLAVPPDKVGHSQSNSPQNKLEEVLISESKFSVLSLDEAEEGEILPVVPTVVEEEDPGVSYDVLECDLMEDKLLADCDKLKGRVVLQRGGKRVQKPKAQDANLLSTRSSRRKN